MTASDSPVKDEANVNKEETHLLEEVARVLADFDKKNQDNGLTDDDYAASPVDTVFPDEQEEREFNDDTPSDDDGPVDTVFSSEDEEKEDKRELLDEELENLVDRFSPTINRLRFKSKAHRLSPSISHSLNFKVSVFAAKIISMFFKWLVCFHGLS